jgi:hypothetical protein
VSRSPSLRVSVLARGSGQMTNFFMNRFLLQRSPGYGSRTPSFHGDTPQREHRVRSPSLRRSRSSSRSPRRHRRRRDPRSRSRSRGSSRSRRFKHPEEERRHRGRYTTERWSPASELDDFRPRRDSRSRHPKQ